MQHEITLPLSPGQTALIYGHNVVSDLFADLIVGYYPGEDSPGGLPYKIALRRPLIHFSRSR